MISFIHKLNAIDVLVQDNLDQNYVNISENEFCDGQEICKRYNVNRTAELQFCLGNKAKYALEIARAGDIITSLKFNCAKPTNVTLVYGENRIKIVQPSKFKFPMILAKAVPKIEFEIESKDSGFTWPKTWAMQTEFITLHEQTKVKFNQSFKFALGTSFQKENQYIEESGFAWTL